MTLKPHPIYEQVLTDKETWTHRPEPDIPVLKAYPGPMTAAGKQLLMSALTYPDGTTLRREIALVGDRPPETRALAYRLNALFGVSYEQAFNRIAQLTEGEEYKPSDKALIQLAQTYREVIAAALYDLGKPTPSRLHIINNPQQLDNYLADHQAVKIRPKHLDYDIEIGGYGEKTLLHGMTGYGKSWMTLQIAIYLALQKKRAAFILTEGGKYAAARVKLAWKKLALDYALHPVLIVPFGQTNLDPEYINRIRKTLEDNNIRILMLDVLSPLLVDENSAGEYNTIRNILAPLTEDRFYLEVHHHNKAGLPRGSGRIVDDAAYDLIVKKSANDNPLLVPGTKSRGTTKTDWSIALDISAGYPQEQAPSPPKAANEELGETIINAIGLLVETLHRPVTQAEILTALDNPPHRKTLERKLQDLADKRLIRHHPKGAKTEGQRVRDGYTL